VIWALNRPRFGDTIPRMILRLLALSLVLLQPSVPSAAAGAQQSNIVFILADDLGYGDLGCYGQKVIKTPHLDRLAGQGMRFTDFYAGSTVCAPSRSCLMTGLHTGHTYLRGNGAHRLRPNPLDPTVGQSLQKAGYQTAMIGKSCTIGNLTDDISQPNKKGFDHFFGVLSHVEAHHYFPPVMYRNGSKVPLADNTEHEGKNYIHDLLLSESLGWMEKQKAKPFFLLYSSLIPHASLYAPEEWVAKYRGRVGPERVIKEGHYRGTKEPNAVFAGMVGRLDWEIGQLMAKLDELGIAENTIVMFASDNGAQSAGGHREGDFNSSGPLRGEKREMYEGGIRSPFIVRWPGRVKAGTVNDHVGAFWDLLPTACELAGTSAPAGIDGISFLPTLLGKDQPKHDYLYWEFFEKGGRRAIRTGDFKLIQYGLMKRPQPIEIYNVAKDLDESEDLASARPDLVQRARDLFRTAHARSPIEKWNFPAKK
jgi:arylsulfatase A